MKNRNETIEIYLMLYKLNKKNEDEISMDLCTLVDDGTIRNWQIGEKNIRASSLLAVEQKIQKYVQNIIHKHMMLNNIEDKFTRVYSVADFFDVMIDCCIDEDPYELFSVRFGLDKETIKTLQKLEQYDDKFYEIYKKISLIFNISFYFLRDDCFFYDFDELCALSHKKIKQNSNIMNIPISEKHTEIDNYRWEDLIQFIFNFSRSSVLNAFMVMSVFIFFIFLFFGTDEIVEILTSFFVSIFSILIYFFREKMRKKL